MTAPSIPWSDDTDTTEERTHPAIPLSSHKKVTEFPGKGSGIPLLHQ